MKKGLLILIAAATLPWTTMATSTLPKPSLGPVASIPARFVSTSQTSTYEWGCPVSELVQASTEAGAVLSMGKQCMEEARKAASLKPGVFEVIKVSVIVPDVNVTKHAEGYMLKGTYFLETLVLKGME